jgi:hypothetical protein
MVFTSCIFITTSTLTLSDTEFVTSLMDIKLNGKSFTRCTMTNSTLANAGTVTFTDSRMVSSTITHASTVVSQSMTITQTTMSDSTLNNYGRLVLSDTSFSLSAVMYAESQVASLQPPPADYAHIVDIYNMGTSARLTLTGGQQVHSAVASTFGNTGNCEISTTGIGDLRLWGQPAVAGTCQVLTWIIPKGTSASTSLGLTLDKIYAVMAPQVSLVGPLQLLRTIVVCQGQCLINGPLTMLDSAAFQGQGNLITAGTLSFSSTAPGGESTCTCTNTHTITHTHSRASTTLSPTSITLDNCGNDTSFCLPRRYTHMHARFSGGHHALFHQHHNTRQPHQQYCHLLVPTHITYTHTHTHAYIKTYTHTYRHTCIHTYRRIHLYTQEAAR